MTTNEFLPLLDHVKPTPRGWRARCPAHEGKSLSLSIREAEDGRILLHCFAGCPTPAVCKALNLPVRELFAPTQRSAAEIQHDREQRELKRLERERAQRVLAEAADAERKARRLIASAKDASIDHWTDAYLDLLLNRLADAYELMGDSNGRE